MKTTIPHQTNKNSDRDLFQFQCFSLDSKPRSPKRLCWRVFVLDINSQKIIPINVFELNWTMNKRIYEATKNINSYKEWEQNICSALHELWSRYQYELNMSDLSCSSQTQTKIDCFTQITINWENFIDYLWYNKNIILEELNN